MKEQIKSIFNLIEIFRTTRTSHKEATITHSHCENNHHHDFYCDAEKPFISL